MLIDFIAITAMFSLVYVLVSLAISFSPGIYAMFANFALFGLNLWLFVSKKITYRQSTHFYVANACLVAILMCSWFSGRIVVAGDAMVFVGSGYFFAAFWHL